MLGVNRCLYPPHTPLLISYLHSLEQGYCGEGAPSMWVRSGANGLKQQRRWFCGLGLGPLLGSGYSATGELNVLYFLI